jgi:hypothetical protein
MLSAVASSAIGGAGTVFSVRVAALSLVSGRMEPRPLRNLTRDPGNQIALGIFVGTLASASVCRVEDVERDPRRRASLRRHAELARAAAQSVEDSAGRKAWGTGASGEER